MYTRPHSNAPETPTEDSNLEHVHAMLKNTTSMTRMTNAAVGIPVGREFTLSVNVQRRRSV